MNRRAPESEVSEGIGANRSVSESAGISQEPTANSQELKSEDLGYCGVYKGVCAVSLIL